MPQDEINHHINPDRSIAARVLGLAWPVIVENSLMTMVNVADVAMVGRLGKVAIASASLPGSPIFFSQALFSAISIGTTALVARLIGAREKDQANKALRQSFFIAVILGLIVTAILVGFARPIMSLMGATGEVLTTSSMYLRVSCSTFFFMTLSFILNGALRGAGDTKTPMITNIIANFVNLFLNYVLIHGIAFFPEMGVAGAALATAISRAVGGLLVLGVTLSNKAKLHLDLKFPWTMDADLMRRMLKVGLPAAGEQFVMRGSSMIMTRMITGLGTLAYASHSLVANFESVSFMIGLGFSMSASSLVGQHLGAKDQEGANACGHMAAKVAAIAMGTFGAIFLLVPQLIIGIYSTDPEVIALGSSILRMAGLSQIPLALNIVYSGGLRGAGDTQYVFWVSVLGNLVLRLGLIYFFAYILDFGVVGAWIGTTIDVTIRSIFITLRFHSGKWRSIKV